MHIGLIFGSFDPIHIGHLDMAYQALNNGWCDGVCFVPAKQNPWKFQSTDFEARIEMLRGVCMNMGPLYYTTLERNLSGKTFDTLEALDAENQRRGCNYEFIIITTPETFKDIPNWYRGQEILDRYEVKVVDIRIPVHATQIRELISQHKTPLPFITEPVYNFIKQNNLYGYEEDFVNH